MVLTVHLTTALNAMLWFNEKIKVYPRWLLFSSGLSNVLFAFSLLALWVMSVDRYLATHYPLVYRTSVTKGKLLTLFTFLAIIHTTVMAISVSNLVVSYQFGLLIFGILVILPML